MGTLAFKTDERVQSVEWTDTTFCLHLMDGRSLFVPLAGLPKLAAATFEQKNNWEISDCGYGLYWDEIDEHFLTEELLKGVSSAKDRITCAK